MDCCKRHRRQSITSMNNRNDRRNRGLSPILISLFYQLYTQLERSGIRPPVTIAFLIINILVHLHPSPYFGNIYLGDIQRICIHPRKIVDAFYYDHELLWPRLFLSSVVHADDVHLYYNMLSLCWKGINLEQALGSSQFLFLILFGLVASHTIMVLIAYVLYEYIGMDGYSSGFTTCAVGFSAVLFCLKYVWNARSPHLEPVMGFMVPSKYAAWLELVVISLITPNASFIGHLAGILAGVLYVHGPMEVLLWIPNWIQDTVAKLTGGGRGSQSRTYGRGTASHDSETFYTYESSSNNGHNDEIELEYVEDLPGNDSTPTATPNLDSLRNQRLNHLRNRSQNRR